MFKKYLLLFISLSTVFGADIQSAHLTANDFNLMWLIPFVGILLSIAIAPLISPVFWHHHYGKISAFWGVLFLFFFMINFFDYTLFYVLEVY